MEKEIKNIITSILLSLQMWFWLVNLNNNSTPQGLYPKEEINYFRVIIVLQQAEWVSFFVLQWGGFSSLNRSRDFNLKKKTNSG